MIPNGVCSAYPPANGCPPGAVGHAAQCPIADRASPFATKSAGKLAGTGRAMGAIEGRHAKAKKTTPARKTARRDPTKTRRVFGLLFQSVPESLLELDFISLAVSLNATARQRANQPKDQRANGNAPCHVHHVR